MHRSRTLLAGITALVLGLGLTVVAASPASAADGHITGTVTAAGVPRDDFHVAVYEVGGDDWVASDLTDANGAFDVAVPPGDYQVRIAQDTPDPQFVPEWWQDAYAQADATVVHVADGETVGGIDAAVGGFHTVSGQVTIPGGGAVDTEVEVHAYDPDADDWYVYWDYFSDWEPDGSYVLSNMAPGDYRIGFLPEDTTYSSEWWDDQRSFETATTVTVPPTSDVTGVDAVLDEAGHITGSVTDESGGGIWGVDVTAYELDGGDWVAVTQSYATTDDDGLYDLGNLDPGTYRVGYDGGDEYVAEYWDDQPDVVSADDVVVEAEGDVVDGIDAELASTDVADGGISGVVTNAQGAPLEDMRVSAWRFDPDLVGSEDAPDGWDQWNFDYTSATGTYTLGQLPPGDYRVLFYDRYSAGYLDEWYDDAPTLEEADDVTVTSGVMSAGTNAVLARAATISGLVTTQYAPSGDWFDLVLYRKQPDGSFGFSDYTNSIDHDSTAPYAGSYEFRNVAPGTYRIGIDGDDEFADEYWNDKPTLALADDIVVVGPEPVTGKSFHLTTNAPLTIVNTVRPVVTGSESVGATLTASTGSWTPEPTSYTYRWFVDDVAVPGATGSTYLVRPEDLDTRIAVEVTAAKEGHASGVRTSEQTGYIAGPTVANTGLPTVTGTPKVGATLSATAGAWNPVPSSVTFQWLEDGHELLGETGSTHVIPEWEFGGKISVEVTASKAAFVDGNATSAQTAPVGKGDMVNTSLPTITLPAAPGGIAYAYQGLWTPAPSTYAYQWLLNGVPVTGAISSEFQTRPSDLGKSLTVQVTASRSTTTPTTATSTAAVIRPGTISVEGAPYLNTGRPHVGRKLSVWAGSYRPTGWRAAYQWLADGKPIAKKSTKRIYKATKKQFGQRLSARVTISFPGYTPYVVTTKETKPVQGPLNRGRSSRVLSGV